MLRNKNIVALVLWDTLPLSILVFFLCDIPAISWGSALQRYPEIATFPPGPLRLFSHLAPNSLEALLHFSVFSYRPTLLLFLVPYRKVRIPAGLFFLLLTIFLTGFSASSGKVGHSLVMRALPGLIALDLMFRSHFFLKTSLFLFFLQSGLAKLTGGWLDLDTLAIRNWLLQLETEGWVSSWGYRLVKRSPNFALGWKAIDYLIVFSEIALSYVMLKGWQTKNRFLTLAVLATFHLMVLSFFGIAFTFVYPAYWWAAKPEEDQGIETKLWLSFGLAYLSLWVLSAGPLAIHLSLLLLSLSIYFSLSPQKQPFVPSPPKWVRGTWLSVLLVSLLVSLFKTEPWPSFGGPKFGLATSSGTNCASVCHYSVSPKEKQFSTGFWTWKFRQYLHTREKQNGDILKCPNHLFLPSEQAEVAYLRAVENVLKENKLSFSVREETHCF